MSDDDAGCAAVDDCTLPTAERPLRVAEFDELFARSVRSQERAGRVRLRWTLDPVAEAVARDLTARESRCCSFFTFTFRGGAGDDGALVVEVEVPEARVAVLDALAERAAARIGA